MHTEKSIATILAETKDELKQFVTTRVNILKAEMDEKISRIKSVIPLAVVAALFLRFRLDGIYLCPDRFAACVYSCPAFTRGFGQA